MQPSEDISAPVIPEGSQEKSSCLAQIGWAIGIGIVGFAFIILFIPFRIGREKAAMLQRSHGLRSIMQAVSLYEQSHHVAMATLPDWKKALIDSGYVVADVFESNDAENGEIDYLLMSRRTEQFVPGLPSCFAICEDPRTLQHPYGNVYVIFEGDSYGKACARRDVPQFVQRRYHSLNLQFDLSLLQPAFAAPTTDATR